MNVIVIVNILLWNIVLNNASAASINFQSEFYFKLYNMGELCILAGEFI